MKGLERGMAPRTKGLRNENLVVWTDDLNNTRLNSLNPTGRKISYWYTIAKKAG